MKKTFFRLLRWFLLLFLVYVIAGALLPFVHTKETGDAFKQQFRVESFYREGESVDRARVVETSMDALEAADRGVKIRILVDGLYGAVHMHGKYVIVDDKLLLLGGRNTFNYFLGEYNLTK